MSVARPAVPSSREDQHQWLSTLDSSSSKCPPSVVDAFVLGLSRACANDVVTTGANHRAETGLAVSLDALDALPEPCVNALRRFGAQCRRERRAAYGSLVGGPGRTVLLTRSANEEPQLLDSPFFDAHHLRGCGPRPMLWAGSAVSALVRSRAEARGVGIVTRDEPTLAGVLSWLRSHDGVDDALPEPASCRDERVISIEAGPRTALQLYPSPFGGDDRPHDLVERVAVPAVDTVLLSVYTPAVGSAGVPAEALVRPLCTEAMLDQWFRVAGGAIVAASDDDEGDTRGASWTFVLMHRR